MATTKVSLHRSEGRSSPWLVRWYGAFDPITGKAKRYCKTFRLKRDAERFQSEKRAAHDRGSLRDRPADVSIRAFCRTYMDRRNHEWAAKTQLHVDDLCNRLLGFFGSQTLVRRITPERAAEFWSKAKVVREGMKDAQLSRATRNRILRDLKAMFRYAVAWGYLTENPFAPIKQLRVAKQQRRCWHYVTPSEYQRLLRVAPDLRWKVLYALAYTSAARSGELFNLTVDNVDFERGNLRIESREGSDVLPPFQVKDHEARLVPLPRHTIRLLRGWLTVRSSGSPLILLTPQRYQRIMNRWRDHQHAGRPWLNDYMVNNVLRSLRHHAKWAGIVPKGVLTMHGFRKSCAQNWADHLPMHVVQELMGHANITTTAEFYTQVSDAHEEQARQVIQKVTCGDSSQRFVSNSRY